MILMVHLWIVQDILYTIVKASILEFLNVDNAFEQNWWLFHQTNISASHIYHNHCVLKGKYTGIEI